MYSYEIEELLKLKNYIITVQDYVRICSSPQVDHVSYKDDNFHIWTDDNYEFVLKIKL